MTTIVIVMVIKPVLRTVIVAVMVALDSDGDGRRNDELKAVLLTETDVDLQDTATEVG